jgi:hypothetical protein
MISVCIPVFNTDARKLAESLLKQASGIPAEIILIDDGSDESYRKLNRSIKAHGVRYHELSGNTGRAIVRNRFSDLAEYGHLLFLDCDSVILSETFLSDYALSLKDNPDSIICGGRIYGERSPGRKYRLHWEYGKLRESRPLQARLDDPARSFMTNNFLIPAGYMRDTPFDERISGYGHEDTLFGFMQARKGRTILHIDNPVLHGQLETNRVFLVKTGEAVRNLILITGLPGIDPGFADTVTLLSTMHRLEEAGWAGIVRCLSRVWLPISARLLRAGYGGLELLDSYKLGLCLILKRQSEKAASPS